MFPRLTPVLPSDEPVLFDIYISARAEELKFVPWTDQQKKSFLESQFHIQSQYYFSKYPNASYNLIILDNQPVGRLYSAALADEIRIIDLTILPEFRRQGIGTKLISALLETGKTTGKPVRIYLETNNSSATLFSRLGFTPVSDDGVYCLWERYSVNTNQTHTGSEFSTAGEAV